MDLYFYYCVQSTHSKEKVTVIMCAGGRIPRAVSTFTVKTEGGGLVSQKRRR